MAYKVYDFPPLIKGDTFAGVQFTVTVNGSPLDLTNAIITMDFRKKGTSMRSLRLSTLPDVGGITILTPADGIFKLDAQIIDIPAVTYDYDIEIKLGNNEVKTYIKGTVPIVQDITYG